MHHKLICAFLLFLLSPSACFLWADETPIDADILLMGGTIHDGSGEAPKIGDVAIRGDKIVAVGKFTTGKVGKTIDCASLIVAPGFIDLHNHSDFELETEKEESGETAATRPIHAPETRSSACYLTQGCTTLVTGNCGGGALDIKAYYEELEKTPPGINVAQLIPQGSVRAKVIGETRRAPTDKELQQMLELARQGMLDGAWGMTTGLQYVPSAYATTDEIAAMAKVVGQHGGFYASHIRNEGDTLLESIEEALDIGRSGNLPVHVSHFKASNKPNWGKVRAGAALIEKAQAEGMRVTADQYPYDASSTTITAMLLPDEEREGGDEALIKRLNDPEQVGRMRPIIEESLAKRGRIMVARCPQYPQWIGKLIEEIAKEENRTDFDVALDILRTGDEAGVSFSMDEADVRYVMTLPWVATASDGGVKIDDGTRPHPRSFGTFPRKIGRYAIQEKVIPLEQAIRSATGLAAEIMGIKDRGYLRPDQYADVVVFDPQTFRDLATFESPFETSTGVDYLLVNGQLAIDDGKLAVTNAGRPLRKPQ
jgi:N-acyl-D-aspartate/D-glutamate deacylase